MTTAIVPVAIGASARDVALPPLARRISAVPALGVSWRGVRTPIGAPYL